MLKPTDLEQIENKITELAKMRDALYMITDACCGGDEPATSCTILSALDDDHRENQDPERLAV